MLLSGPRVRAERPAFSDENGAVDFLEVFEPTTLEDYEARIYEDPGPFIR